jgi:hypothetical protein
VVGSGNPAKVHVDLPEVDVGTVEEVLARPGVDVVVIATPNDTHVDLARRALEAGKHVVVDKPFTLTLAEARVSMLTVSSPKRLDEKSSPGSEIRQSRRDRAVVALGVCPFVAGLRLAGSSA